MAISRSQLGKTTDKKLKSGQSNKKVVKPKQAVAIALSEAGVKRKNRRS